MQTDKTKPGTASSTTSQDRPGLADAARDAARREMDDARSRLHGAADRARAEASTARNSVSRLMMDELDKRKGSFCEGIRGVADAMRKAADEAEDDERVPAPPRMVHQAVNTLEDLSDRLEQQSAEEIGRNLSRYGRENPTLFVAGALLAGLAAGRFLVSSSEASERGPRSNRDDDRFDSVGAAQRQGYGSAPSYGSSSSGAASSPYGGTARSGAQRYGTDAREDLPSGTGTPGSAGMHSGAATAGTGGTSGAMNEGTARDLKYGQGGIGQPGGAKAGGTSNLGTGSGTAGYGQSTQKPGDKDGAA